MARPLTVVQMLPGLQSGGVERGTLELAGFLARNGHRSIVISGGGRLVPQLEREGSVHVSWRVGEKTPRCLQYLLPLRALFLNKKVDILHLRSRVPAWLGYFAWKSISPHKRPRLVTTVHGYYSVNCLSAIMTKGERVIAVSESIKQYITENYPRTPSERISVIYRGIDPSNFAYGYAPPKSWEKEWFSRYPQLNGRFVIAMISRITRLKGHPFFFDLIEKLLKKGIPVHGLVVGEADAAHASYMKELQQHLKQKGLDPYILFTGYCSEIKNMMASVHAVVSFSRKPESFGRTVLEALSLGIPVAGFDRGGVGELLKALFPAGLIKEDDMHNAATVLSHIYKTRPLPSRNNSFTLESMLTQTVDLYQDLMESPRSIQ